MSISAYNPKSKPELGIKWKVVNNADPGSSYFGGRDFDKIFSIPQSPNTIVVQDRGNILLTVDMDKRIVDIKDKVLHDLGYTVKDNSAIVSLLEHYKIENNDLRDYLEDQKYKVKQYRWALREIESMLTKIKIEWNTVIDGFIPESFANHMKDLEDFVRSQRQ